MSNEMLSIARILNPKYAWRDLCFNACPGMAAADPGGVVCWHVKDRHIRAWHIHIFVWETITIETFKINLMMWPVILLGGFFGDAPGYFLPPFRAFFYAG